MQSNPLLPLLPGPLWSGVVAPDMVLSMDQIELNCVLTLNWIVCNKTVLTFIWAIEYTDCFSSDGQDPHWTTRWWGFSNAGALGNAEYPFINIPPMSSLALSGSSWLGPIYESNRIKLCTYAGLNLFWSELFWILKMCTYANLNCF